MSLDASTLQVVVQSSGIEQTTKALNDLAKAGENAEKKTSNIGTGAKAAAKAQVDAAQQAADGFNAIIDMMTEKSKTYYADKAMQSALSSQKELFDGMSMMDKLWAYRDDMAQKDATQRAKATADIIAQQEAQYNAAKAASEKILAQQFDAYQKQKAIEASAQAKGDTLNQAGQRAADYKKIQDAAKALKEETDRLAAAEAAERAQREQIDYNKWITQGKAAAAASREQADALAQQQKAEAQLKSDGDAFVAMLKRQAETVGLTTKELKDYNAAAASAKAAQLGVTDQVKGFITTIQNAKGPHESFNLLTAGSAREMMVLAHEMSQGSFQRFGGSMIVLGERINFLPKVFAALGTAAEAVGVSLGVLLTAIAAIAIATVGGIVSYNKSTTALKEMRNEVILTGGALGATGDALYDMSNKIGDATGEFGNARQTVVELAGTGKFTADQIGLITTAAIELEKFGGVSIEKTTAMFEKLADKPVGLVEKGFKGVSDAAMKLDQQLHFLDPTVLAHIVHLEQIGQVSEASRVAISALAEAEKGRAEELKANLSPLGVLMMEIEEKASRMWNAIFHKASKEEQLNDIQEALRKYDASPIWSSINDGMTADKANEMRAKAKSLQNDILQGAYDAEKKAHDVRINALTNEQTIYLRNLDDRAKGEVNLQQRLAQFDNVIAQQRAKAKADPAFAAANASMLSDASVAMMRQQVERDSTRKAAKPKSDGLSAINEQIAQINELADIQKHQWDNDIKLIDFKKQYGIIAEDDAQKQKQAILDKEEDLVRATLEKEIKVYSDFYSQDTKLMEQVGAKKANLQKDLTKTLSDIALSQKKNDAVPDVEYAQAMQAQQDNADKTLASIEKQTKQVQAQVDAYNNLPDAVKQAGVRQKEMASEVEQAKIDSLQAERDGMQSNDLIANAMNARRIKQIDAEIVERQKLKAADVAKESNDKQNSAALNAPAALKSIATEQVKLWKDAGNEIEKALTSAFGNSGKAAGQMFKAFTEGMASQVELTQKISETKNKVGIDETTRTNQLTDLQNQSAQAQIGMYGSMADAAAGFFDKQSTGYKIATSVSKAFHLAEMAMALASIPAKLAAGAATMFAQSGWGGFAGVAAMTAVVAAFGVAVSSGGGGGPMSAADQQKVQGTGTVLGSPTSVNGNKVELVGAKSDSIVHSLSIAEKNSGLGLVVQNDMLDALRKLNDNITSFSTHLVASTNIANPSVKLNTNTGGATTLLESAGFGVVGLAIAKLIPGIGNLFGKIATSIFGGKQSLDDSGVTLGKTSLGSVAANGVNAQSYANITTSGGWFSSDKHSTQLSSLGSDANNQFAQVILSMEDTLKVAAKGLGVDADTFNTKLQSFVVDIGNISFKGMTGDQIQTALQNVFSKLGDQMAEFAFSDLQQYQKVGEGLMETVVRVANDLQQVTDVFNVLGKTIPEAMAGIAASEALITQFGGVDNLTKGVKAYISAIYTDQEKLDPVVKSVSAAFSSLNISGITTKDQFKQLVDGLDITTESGAKMFAQLMAIAPQFGQMVDAAKAAADSLLDKQIALLDAQGRAAESLALSRQKELSAMTDSEQAIQKQIYALQDAASAANLMLNDVDSAYSALSSIISSQKDAINKAADTSKAAAQTQLDAAKTTVTAFQTVFDNIGSSMKSLAEAVDTVKNSSADFVKAKWAEAQAYVVTATAMAASGGDVTQMGGLQSALDTLSKPDTSLYQNYQEYAMDMARTANGLDKLQGATKGQLDTAQLTVDRLNATIKAIEDQTSSELARLDKIASDAKDQVDSIKGQSASLLSIDQGIQALNNAIATARANPLIGGVEAINNAYQNDLGRTPDSAGMDYWKTQLTNGVSPSDITKSIAQSAEAQNQVQQLYQTLLGRPADQGGLDFFTNTLVKGGSLAEIAGDIKNSDEYKNLPSFDVGADYLPRDMIAQLHAGEAVVPAADNAEIKRRLAEGSSSSTSEQVAKKLDQLIGVISSGDVANVQVQREVLKIVKRWDTEGQPETRDVTA